MISFSEVKALLDVSPEKVWAAQKALEAEEVRKNELSAHGHYDWVSGKPVQALNSSPMRTDPEKQAKLLQSQQKRFDEQGSTRNLLHEPKRKTMKNGQPLLAPITSPNSKTANIQLTSPTPKVTVQNFSALADHGSSRGMVATGSSRGLASHDQSNLSVSGPSPVRPSPVRNPVRQSPASKFRSFQKRTNQFGAKVLSFNSRTARSRARTAQPGVPLPQMQQMRPPKQSAFVRRQMGGLRRRMKGGNGTA